MQAHCLEDIYHLPSVLPFAVKWEHLVLVFVKLAISIIMQCSHWVLDEIHTEKSPKQCHFSSGQPLCIVAPV